MFTLGNFEALRAANDSLDSDVDPPLGRWIDGRIVGVLASPELGNAQRLAVGVSMLPAGVATPPHSHVAEEIAIVVAGSGTIVIGSERVTVRAGDVVRTPSEVVHETIADDDSTLHILWVYAPAGSENRWLSGVRP